MDRIQTSETESHPETKETKMNAGTKRLIEQAIDNAVQIENDMQDRLNRSQGGGYYIEERLAEIRAVREMYSKMLADAE